MIPGIADDPVQSIEAILLDGKPVDHYPRHEPQPIADQVMAGCMCGWREAVSIHDYPTRETLWAEVERRYKSHLD
jgi:hypothetical protein